MKLAVSNIAWTKDEEVDAAKLLSELGVKYIEVAPTKQWQDPTIAPSDEVKSYQDFWRANGLEIVAFQSMLFNRPDLKIFENDELKQETLDYLKKFIGLAGKLGAKVLVFGSPKNRQKGLLDERQAQGIARGFFAELGAAAKAAGVEFCIEPNATDYACDFVTTADEGLRFVRDVNEQGFGLHLDIACMTMAGDDIASSITMSKAYLKHFHISAPFLGEVNEASEVDHAAAAEALKGINYQGYVSIEMKPGEPGTNLQRVRDAVLFAQKTYGV